jgi:enoyl-CoA hydratase/carnithine racemase
VPSEILYDVTDHIATITLHRPEKLNAFTGNMMHELLEVFDEVDADDDVRAVIMTGSGRAFCAGADLSAGGDTFATKESGGSGRVHRDGGGRVSLRIFDLKKPIIAAINGPAVGVGITMTLPMDIRVVADTAKIGFVFARRGIVPEACSSWFLPRLVGISQAMEWVATGRIFPAQEAVMHGLARSAHAPDELLSAAWILATEIAANTSAVSVAMARQLMWRMLGASHPMEAHRADSAAMAALGRSADAGEGVTSFLEKRPAAFSDRVSAGLPDAFPGWAQPTFDVSG